MQFSHAISIRHIDSEEDLRLVFHIVHELRPKLDVHQFIERVRVARSENYLLAALFDGGSPVAVAGYRKMTSLSTGATLYIDDLVTTETRRSQGYGRRLFEFVCGEGIRLGCETLSLDSGYPRRDAHRFYLNQGMAMVSHHFAMKLQPA